MTANVQVAAKVQVAANAQMKKKETTSLPGNSTVKKRGCDAAATFQVKSIMKYSADKAKTKLLSWAKTVGTEGGYQMSHGRRAPSNDPRDPDCTSKKIKKLVTDVRKK